MHVLQITGVIIARFPDSKQTVGIHAFTICFSDINQFLLLLDEQKQIYLHKSFFTFE